MRWFTFHFCKTWKFYCKMMHSELRYYNIIFIVSCTLGVCRSYKNKRLVVLTRTKLLCILIYLSSFCMLTFCTFDSQGAIHSLSTARNKVSRVLCWHLVGTLQPHARLVVSRREWALLNGSAATAWQLQKI